MDINSYIAPIRGLRSTQFGFVQRNQTLPSSSSSTVTATSDADAREGGREEERRARRNEIWKPVPNTRGRFGWIPDMRRDPETDIHERQREEDEPGQLLPLMFIRREQRGYGDWACRSSRINSPFPGPEPLRLFDEIRGSSYALRFHPSEF